MPMSVSRILFAMFLCLLLACLFAVLVKLAEARQIINRKGGIRNACQAAKERKNYTDLDHISPTLIAAVVNSEDPFFFEHKAYDVKGIYFAIKKNFKAKKLIYGGSTITQQLCKNVFLTREKTFRRKILELIISIRMEKVLSKQEILEWYFNILNFNECIVGVFSISEILFHKKPCQLGVREALIIAGSMPCPRLRLPGKKLYDYGFKQCISICTKYGKLFSVDDLDALEAMADRDDPRMEKKYGEVARNYCKAKGIRTNSESK